MSGHHKNIPPGPDEEVLVRKALEGDERAFNELFERYKDYSYRIAFHLLGDGDEAADCVSSAWLKVHTALIRKAFRFESRFSTWLYAVVTNEALMHRRQAGRTVRLDDPFLKESLSKVHTEELTLEERVGRKIEIGKLMTKLSPTQQRIVGLLLEGYSFPEIAERLGIKPNHLYQLTLRIRKLLEH